MAKINQEEYKLLKSLGNNWKWIARDLKDSVLSDKLWIYEYNPKRDSSFWTEDWGEYKELPYHLFRFIKWEDLEPHSIDELIREYEDESEETEVKSKQELIEKWELAIESAEFYGKGKEEEIIGYMKDFVSDLNQLDEPEVLSQEWIDENKVARIDNLRKMTTHDVVSVDKLKDLLVPKREEVDRAYKDGYEKRKEHATRDDEPETVASVFVDYLIASAKLKLALKMEVEELE